MSIFSKQPNTTEASPETWDKYSTPDQQFEVIDWVTAS